MTAALIVMIIALGLIGALEIYAIWFLDGSKLEEHHEGT